MYPSLEIYQFKQPALPHITIRSKSPRNHSEIHRKGPKPGISDVCSRNHTFQIHRDATKTSDSDVSLFIQYRHLVVVIVLEVIGFGASEVDNQKHDQQGDD